MSRSLKLGCKGRHCEDLALSEELAKILLTSALSPLRPIRAPPTRMIASRLQTTPKASKTSLLWALLMLFMECFALSALLVIYPAVLRVVAVSIALDSHKHLMTVSAALTALVATALTLLVRPPPLPGPTAPAKSRRSLAVLPRTTPRAASMPSLWHQRHPEGRVAR